MRRKIQEGFSGFRRLVSCANFQLIPPRPPINRGKCIPEVTPQFPSSGRVHEAELLANRDVLSRSLPSLVVSELELPFISKSPKRQPLRFNLSALPVFDLSEAAVESFSIRRFPFDLAAGPANSEMGTALDQKNDGQQPLAYAEDAIPKDPETARIETARDVAERGQAATDHYGRSLVQFDPAAEARLLWKIDLFIVPTVALLYLFCFIDRANIGNAKLAGLERDLNLKNYDYNTVLSIFYVSYIVFEIPSNMACKWIGPGWYIPAISLGFGITSVATAFVRNIHEICGVRFVLGIFEAGMLPGIAYYMSRWYRKSELVFRLSLYIVMAPLAGAFGGLLASAILKLPNFGNLHEWRMIFAIEGIITCGISLVGFVTLTDRPATAFWLTQEEKDLAIARVKSERVGATEVLDKLDTRKTLLGIFGPVTMVTAFIFLLNNITVQGLAFFAPTIVKTIYPNDSVVSQQLHTVPPYVVGGFFTVLFPFLSWKFNRRLIFFILSAPLVMIGYIMFLASDDPKVRYGATFIIASGAFAFGALSNASVSANVVSDTARSSAIGTNVMFGNIGGLISTWSFLPFDSPDYHIGNGLNLATSSTILICSIALVLWMNLDNKKRDMENVEEKLAGLSQTQIQNLDWRHPGFRWKT